MSAAKVVNLVTNDVDVTKLLVALTRIFTKKGSVVASICFYKCFFVFINTLKMKISYRTFVLLVCQIFSVKEESRATNLSFLDAVFLSSNYEVFSNIISSNSRDSNILWFLHGFNNLAFTSSYPF